MNTPTIPVEREYGAEQRLALAILAGGLIVAFAARRFLGVGHRHRARP